MWNVKDPQVKLVFLSRTYKHFDAKNANDPLQGKFIQFKGVHQGICDMTWSRGMSQMSLILTESYRLKQMTYSYVLHCFKFKEWKTLVEEVPIDHFGQNEFFCANLLVLVWLIKNTQKKSNSNVKYENRPPCFLDFDDL